MIALTDDMRNLVDNALANGCPCVLATVSADGEPDIGYKGSMMVFDNESLAYWERTRRQHLKNVLSEKAPLSSFGSTASRTSPDRSCRPASPDDSLIAPFNVQGSRFNVSTRFRL